MRNGEIVGISDLFKSDYDYETSINNEVKNQIKELEKNQNAEGVYEFTSISKDQKFYIKDQNLVIYFDLYEIAPYAAGIPEFKIDINRFDENIKNGYIIFFK